MVKNESNSDINKEHR